MSMSSAFFVWVEQQRVRTKAYSQPPLVFTRTLTSTEIKNLKATPLVLIGAPGAELAIVVERVIAHVNFLTAAYATGTWGLYVGPTANGLSLWAEGLPPLGGAANTITELSPTVTVGVVASAVDANVANQPLIIANTAAGEFDTGAGTMDLTILYRVVPAVPV